MLGNHSQTRLAHRLLNHLQEELGDLSPEDTIHDCGADLISRLTTQPDAIVTLAYKKLHVYPFSNVPTCWRRAYEEASLWQVVRVLEGITKGRDEKTTGFLSATQAGNDWTDEVVRLCDMALIMTGGPGRKELIMWILRELEDGINERKEFGIGTTSTHGNGQDGRLEPRRKRLKLSLPPPKHHVQGQPDQPIAEYQSELPEMHRTSTITTTISSPPPQLPQTFPTTNTPIPKIKHPLARLDNPELDTFHTHMHHKRTPVILTHTIDHWPALHKWPNPQYWLQRTIQGRRLVPVELGKSYTDEGWGQRIVRFTEFLEHGLLKSAATERDFRGGSGTGEGNGYGYGYDIIDNPGDFDPIFDDEDGIVDNTGDFDPVVEDEERIVAGNSDPFGGEFVKKRDMFEDTRQLYLAQHDLISQIPALRNDIGIPDYCYLSPPPAAAPLAQSKHANTTSPAAFENKTASTPHTMNDTSTHKPPSSPHPASPTSETTETTEAPAAADAETEPDHPRTLLNIWLGPASTISPCHTDPHHNILAQVFGQKYIRLFAPEETQRLYPMGVKHNADTSSGGDGNGGDVEKGNAKTGSDVREEEEEEEEEGNKRDEGVNMSNTSNVDISCFLEYESCSSCSSSSSSITIEAERGAKRAAQLRQYPDFKDAKYIEGILEPGECLYIPKGWWHYVQSLSVSCSFSFWWD